MPAVSSIESPDTPELRDFYATIEGASRGLGVLNVFKVMAHSPELMQSWWRMMGRASDTPSTGCPTAGGSGREGSIARHYEAQGIDQLILIVQHGPTKHEAIMDSLRRVDEEVIPHFQEAKAQV